VTLLWKLYSRKHTQTLRLFNNFWSNLWFVHQYWACFWKALKMARRERSYYEFLFLIFGCEISKCHNYYHRLGSFFKPLTIPNVGSWWTYFELRHWHWWWQCKEIFKSIEILIYKMFYDILTSICYLIITWL